MSPLSNEQIIRPARHPSKKKLLKQGMRVKIATDETMKVERMIPHYKDMALDERNLVWYSPKEMNRTLNECKETLRAMQ